MDCLVVNRLSSPQWGTLGCGQLGSKPTTLVTRMVALWKVIHQDTALWLIVILDCRHSFGQTQKTTVNLQVYVRIKWFNLQYIYFIMSASAPYKVKIDLFPSTNIKIYILHLWWRLKQFHKLKVKSANTCKYCKYIILCAFEVTHFS